MPLRYAQTGAVLRRLATPRFFSTSSARALPTHHEDHHRLHAAKNHYEVLGLHYDATPEEIKKSFYTLSKRHHPDLHPHDPHASKRFMLISEAYAVLGNVEKRARYDRDVLRRNPHTAHPHGHRQGASYHSTGPAGGRPASGLSSRRRTTFTGPPPSFYRSGGWGAHGAKRRAAHEESTGFGFYGTAAGSGSSSSSSQTPGGRGPHPYPGTGGFAGGMGPGQSPYRPFDPEVPHFDRHAHEMAQERRNAEHRMQRMARERGINLEDSQSSTTMPFWAAALVLGAVVGGPFLLSGVWEKMNRKEGHGKRNGR